MTTYIKTFILTLSLSTVGLLPISAKAQASTSETNELTAVFECRAEMDAMKRLACYDAAVGLFEEAQEQGEIVTISKKQIEEVEKDSFGFNLPSIPKLGSLFGSRSDKEVSTENPLTDPVGGQKSAESTKTPAHINKPRIETPKIKEIEATIAKTQTFAYKKTRFFLENGQVWEQIDSERVRIPKIRNGNIPTVVIQKASLGSFMLRVNGKGVGIRVKRVH